MVGLNQNMTTKYDLHLFIFVFSGVIDVLVNSGRHIDAVNLAFSFGLTEQFSHVMLLKSYLAEAIKVPSTVKAGSSSPTAQVFPLNSTLAKLRVGKFDPLWVNGSICVILCRCSPKGSIRVRQSTFQS